MEKGKYSSKQANLLAWATGGDHKTACTGFETSGGFIQAELQAASEWMAGLIGASVMGNPAPLIAVMGRDLRPDIKEGTVLTIRGGKVVGFKFPKMPKKVA